MKRSIILTALFIVFTAMCFGLSCFLPEYAGVFMKVWYCVMLLSGIFTAAEFVSLSLKLKKLRRMSRENKRGKEKRK